MARPSRRRTSRGGLTRPRSPNDNKPRGGETEAPRGEKIEMAFGELKDAVKGAKIRLGMVGGGEGAFIGTVHRLAARMDGHYDLGAGASACGPDKAGRSGGALGLAADRVYPDYEAMAKAEAARPDGIEAVAIVTPNHVHAGPTYAFLKAGIHVICDKPLTLSRNQAASSR